MLWEARGVQPSTKNGARFIEKWTPEKSPKMEPFSETKCGRGFRGVFFEAYFRTPVVFMISSFETRIFVSVVNFTGLRAWAGLQKRPVLEALWGMPFR